MLKVFRLSSFVFLIPLLLVMVGCGNTLVGTTEKTEDLFKKNPMTVSWNDGVGGAITSFEANVEVYRMNSRKDTAPNLQRTYRMATKTIGSTVYSRIDLSGSPLKTRSFSAVSDGSQTVVFDTNTNSILLRSDDSADVSPELRTLGFGNALSRVDLSLIRASAQRLALDMAEETGNKLVLSIPSSMIKAVPSQTRVSTKISFDTENEIVTEIETITAQDDGSTVTTTSTPVYELVDDVPVKVGMITMVDTKTPTLVEGFDPAVPVYNSIDDIPILSQEKAGEMKAEGQLHEANDVVFGNPADLSNVETVVEIYQDVRINQTDDTVFKMLLEGK